MDFLVIIYIFGSKDPKFSRGRAQLSACINQVSLNYSVHNNLVIRQNSTFGKFPLFWEKLNQIKYYKSRCFSLFQY